MTRVLLDQGLPRGAASLLREAGWDAQHVGDHDMAQAEDSAILEVARRENRIVIKLDADFHALLALAGHDLPSVVRIREEGLKSPEIASLIQRVFTLAGADLAQGALLTVANGKLRIKHLPITK